jgi:hypothetical protein
LELTGHHRLEGARQRREVFLGRHLGLVHGDEQPGTVTRSKAPDAAQYVLEGSGGAPGAKVRASAGRGASRARADAELRLELLGAPAKTFPELDGLGYAL